MKPYKTYQYIPGTEMTERDKQEIGSKFWNRGKWDNFVAPFLPEDCTDMSLVDMGCNAGLFLHFAEDRGFKKVIGVDADEPAVTRGLKWRDEIGGTYEIRHAKINECIDDLPIVDYTIMANVHYYFTINDWIDYLDKLRTKTQYVVLVTAEKKHINRCWASADIPSIRNYFKDWEEVGFIDELPLEGEPGARRLWGICFKSKHLDKVPVENLDSSNHVQDKFYSEIDEGKHFTETKYYRILKPYRKNWSQERLHRWMEERVKVYQDLKKNGQKVPILVDFFKEDRILDGNHRYSGLVNLGYKKVFIRYV